MYTMQITLDQNMNSNTYYLCLFIHLATAGQKMYYVFHYVVINIMKYYGMFIN
jgi:hypothetical protein